MPKRNVFISYSHKNKQYLDELLPFLQSVPGIADVVWFDTQKITIGDKFHDEIQQALRESRVAILLLSEHFLTSKYIAQHELPFLIKEADKRDLELGCLYLTKIPEATLTQIPELKSRIGANSPDNPLDKLPEGERKTIYAKLADWVADQFKDHAKRPFRFLRHRQGSRYELAITIRKQRDHWQHSFSLPDAPDFEKPKLDYPPLELLSEYSVRGEDLFQLLFGSDEQESGAILGAAFDAGAVADPTRDALRVRLLTDDDRLCALPWTEIAYRGRPLHQVGWTVELHADIGPGFPEYPSHTCLFPGKVVLLASRDTADAAHFQDLLHFFQRSWPKNLTPAFVASAQALRSELRAGSTRLVYYFGPATRNGLLLEGAHEDEQFLPWAELSELLSGTRSVSAVFLNLLGESSRAAIPESRILLQGTKAVLMQCSERAASSSAAKAALDWLRNVLTGEQLDPVVTLHRHRHGLAVAWTCYSSWRTVAPQQLEHPDLVDLLLDRRRQRAELLQAKEDFYTFRARRIYHAVTLGSRCCQVSNFPNTASQHLKLYGRKDHEVVIHHTLQVTPGLTDAKRVDDTIRRQLRIEARGSFVSALLRQETSFGSDFWFLILGWTLSKPLANAETGTRLIHAVTDWCHTRLGEDIAQVPRDINVRVISVLALESSSDDITAELENTVTELSERYDDEDAFHTGELDRLGGVRRQDLTHYFQDTQICHCDDRYRKDFPRLLLGGRTEMPFEEAVKTIKRGDPDNWGNLYEELKTMTDAGDWPPTDYDTDFWERDDER